MNNKNKILNAIKNSSVTYTLIAIVTGFIVGAILLAAIGISPVAAHGKLLDGIFGKGKYIAWSVVYASPLILTGLSVAFSFSSTLTTIIFLRVTMS